MTPSPAAPPGRSTRARIRAATVTAATVVVAVAGSTGLLTTPADAQEATQLYETRWFHDDKIAGVMKVTLHPNGDAEWWSRADNEALARRDYHFECAVVSPTGLVLTSKSVDRNVKGDVFGSKRARDRHTWTDRANPNVQRHYDAILAAGGVVTERVGLMDDGVHYTYDCYLDDKS